MFEELLASLDTAGVRFVVVGGVAVVLHGYARLTADLDLVLDLERANVERAIECLTALALRPTLPVPAADFADPAIRQRWIENHNLQVFSLYHPQKPMVTVDLFAREPVPFETLWTSARIIEIGGRAIRIASLEHLIAMKRLSARPQDLTDVEQLEALARRPDAS